jgi:hypothetical protein
LDIAVLRTVVADIIASFAGRARAADSFDAQDQDLFEGWVSDMDHASTTGPHFQSGSGRGSKISSLARQNCSTIKTDSRAARVTM